MDALAHKPRFTADHMVIRLGKYLRIIGCDAMWDPALRTHDLILQANAEGRLFLTRNRHIPDQFPTPADWLLLASPDPVDQFRQVVVACGLDPLAELFSTCIRCNRALRRVTENDAIRDHVHPNVFARHRTFYQCPQCGTVFWHGSHVRNTCRKLGLPAPADTEPAPGQVS